VNISLLSVGTEILLGDTVNTNLSSLGKILYEEGFLLDSEITVADDRNSINEKFMSLLSDNDVVITCGGIGPTEDDFTKEVICEALELDLVIDQDHVEWMKSRWESRGLSMPETNIKQAEIPTGATKLNNTMGTAPGILIEVQNKLVFILPGPPREFIPLIKDEVMPRLKEKYTSAEKDYSFITFFNQPESLLAQGINKFKPASLDLAYLASKGIIKLRYDKNSVSNDELTNFIKNVESEFSEDILAYENISAPNVLFNKLIEQKLTISVVESITGGSFTAELVKFPGASKVLIAGNTLYTTKAKEEFLDTEITEDWVVLSEELSKKSLEKYGTDIAVTILGEAGPVPSSNYAIGEIFISITSSTNTQNTQHRLRGNREDILARSVNNIVWDLINFVK
jgi:nicotinamide-nucleotide amidase